ncbi:DUF1080 domain-containing protein [Duganella sp. FT135W]|uniref:DUF1080 domain-containing protein n=1 Tax=Duganella flavida TaxID=2692175 RepID=A0A6L8K3Y6_9BURK|nr:DUF1080 domain-containing protein [Duganella flavida]MYM22223.1 DUF1080 domain-containing protein [Duganella flavida]
MNKLLIALMLAVSTHSAVAVELFNGRDFSGWELQTTPAASLVDVFQMLPGGVIASAGKPPGFIATRESYRNYKLHVEWRWPGKPGNGGVLLHISPGTFDRVWPVSLQVQTKFGNVGDLLPMAASSFAESLTSAPGVEPRIKAHMAPDSEKPAGEWNTCDIFSLDGMVEVTVNGVLQNRVSNVSPASGRIGFQLEGTPYELRHVELTPLD